MRPSANIQNHVLLVCSSHLLVKKAKKCPFEAIDDTIYEKAAKMIAFKTTSYRLHPWIRATWLYYYDFFGCNNSYNIDWLMTPYHGHIMKRHPSILFV